MCKLLLPPQVSSPMAYDPPMASVTPLAAALERVGDRWSLLVIEALLEGPRRFTYALTEEGHELAGVLRLLADWGSRGSAHAEPMRHALCGTPVEARLWCPTCARSVDEPEADELRRL